MNGGRSSGSCSDASLEIIPRPCAPAAAPKVSAALFSKDILEFFEMLRSYRVRYLIVGGEAVIQFGYARFTADMDIFFEAAATNAGRLYHALEEFWGGTVPGIESADALRGKGKVFQVGRPPNRVILLNSIDRFGFGKQNDSAIGARF